MRASLFLAFGFIGCSSLDQPSRIDQQAAIWQDQASARQAQANAALRRDEGVVAHGQADVDAAEHRRAARFTAGVAAQQAALATLKPVMQRCLDANVRRLAAGSGESVDAVADAALKACRPVITAVARTVELAHLSSAGLAGDVAARLRPEVKGMVRLVRGQAGWPPSGVGE